MKEKDIEKYLEELKNKYPLKNKIRIEVDRSLQSPYIEWRIEKDFLKEFVIHLPPSKLAPIVILHEYFHAVYLRTVCHM